VEPTTATGRIKPFFYDNGHKTIYSFDANNLLNSIDVRHKTYNIRPLKKHYTFELSTGNLLQRSSV